MAALIRRDEAVAKSLLGEENRPPDEKEGPLICFYSFGNEVAQTVILSSKRPSFTSGAHGSGQPSGVSRWFFFFFFYGQRTCVRLFVPALWPAVPCGDWAILF